MSSTTTYISGEIDLAGVLPERRLEIKRILEEFYGSPQLIEEIFHESYLSFEEEWDTHEATDEFVQMLLGILPYLERKTVSRLMCEGETHNDYWSLIIKNGKIYVQRYSLKPIGEKKEFVYSPK